MSKAAGVGKLKGILTDPANRKPVTLLVKSTVAMCTVPLCIYYLCYMVVFAEGVRNQFANPRAVRIYALFRATEKEIVLCCNCSSVSRKSYAASASIPLQVTSALLLTPVAQMLHLCCQIFR